MVGVSQLAFRFFGKNKPEPKEEPKVRANVQLKRKAAESETLRRTARICFTVRLNELAKEHGFVYNKLYIRNNVSRWGSCSAKGNINLNMHLFELPAHLQDFVMLHELCHLKCMNHSAEFHTLLNTLCNGKEKELMAELKTYRIPLQNV
ncbi:MAG: M48 family metallopeptidase [Bacteroidales bacterium]|nr:M48 family metallopeptidase [Bacteroidales bacterium]